MPPNGWRRTEKPRQVHPRTRPHTMTTAAARHLNQTSAYWRWWRSRHSG
ncbi:hypothetical protein ACFOEY_18340 [Paracandidimonas soli]